MLMTPEVILDKLNVSSDVMWEQRQFDSERATVREYLFR